MRILHVTPHLGGGVGKAHAALSAVLPEIVQQTFVLLETPRDRRYVDMVEAAGARVLTAANLAHVASLARESDIVQFEFWNHPRMFECLAWAEFPAMRSVFWSHISGIARPLIQPALMAEAARFVFTTEASLASASVAALRRKMHKKVSVINSGFGFPNAPPRIARGRVPGISYLGTVDFVKMHPGFFDAIDALGDDSVRVAVWGEVDPQGAVAARAKAMRYPNRVEFMGPTSDPEAALANADIFFYPLQREHHGTAENALVEAMSLGLAPLVLDNPAEKAIVRDGQTGFIASSIEEIGSAAGNVASVAGCPGKDFVQCNPCHGGDSDTRDVRTGFHDPLARYACRAGAPLRLRARDRFNTGRMVPVDATSCGHGLGARGLRCGYTPGEGHACSL